MKSENSGTPDMYTGVDNLEVMADAENYNNYLFRLAASHAAPGGVIVDFGAGTGTFATAMRSAGHEVTCVELDNGLRERLAGNGFSAIESAAQLPPQSVDYVYSFNVLEHIENDHDAVSTLSAILKPSGSLLLYVPAYQLLFSSMDRKVGHFRRYRRNQLIRLVEANGFTVKRAEYVDSLGFLAALLYKLVDKGEGQINRTSLVLFDRFVFPLSRLCDRIFRLWFGKNLMVYACKN